MRGPVEDWLVAMLGMCGGSLAEAPRKEEK